MAAMSLRASLLRMALGLGLAVLALALLVESLVLIGASEVTDDYVRKILKLYYQMRDAAGRSR